MAGKGESRESRIEAVMREGERVTPLELFFDLVFVLAITQCTALMAHDPTWSGLTQGLLVLGVLWWTWVGYAWLTSVIDPEEGAVRLVVFAAMAALLVISLCVPEAFADLGLTFAVAYGLVRASHIALFMLASRNDPELRKSVNGLAVGTAIGVSLLATASFFDGAAQGALWFLAIALDMSAPYFFVDAEGWKLEPGHFAERHGLIMIVALGESIVAIGVASQLTITAGVLATAVLGIALAAGLWWVYFDVVALAAGKRLAAAKPGREQNELARDSYSYLHYPLVAAIVLIALGMKKTIGHYDDPLAIEPAFALLGGLALYLLGHVAFRYRHTQTLNRRRTALAIVFLALVPLGTELSALASLGFATALLWGLIAYETQHYGEGRQRLRQEMQMEA